MRFFVVMLLIASGFTTQVQAGKRRHESSCAPPEIQFPPHMHHDWTWQHPQEMWHPSEMIWRAPVVEWTENVTICCQPPANDRAAPFTDQPAPEVVHDTLTPIKVEETYEVQVPYLEKSDDGTQETRYRSESRTRTLVLSTANAQIRYLNQQLSQLKRLKADLSVVEQLKEELKPMP